MHNEVPIVTQLFFFEKNTLQVRKPPGPKLGFRGSLEPNSLLEIDKVHRSFCWGWNSILDCSAHVHIASISTYVSENICKCSKNDKLTSKDIWGSDNFNLPIDWTIVQGPFQGI